MNYLVIIAATAMTLMSVVFVTGAQTLISHLREDVEASQRMAQIRLIPVDGRSAVVRDYARRIPNEADVLILGDSQTYGFGLPPQKTIGAYLQRASGLHVFNMSVVDGRASDQRKIIEILIEERKHFRFVVLNINPSHFKIGLKDPHHIPDTGGRLLWVSLLTTCEPGFYKPPFLELQFFKKQNRSVYELDIYGNNVTVVKGFHDGRLARDYYSGLDASAPHEMIDVLKDAARISGRVIAFASPTHYAVYNQPPRNFGWDIEPVIQAALAHCRSVARVTCIDLSTDFGIEYFTDPIHLNPEGSSLLAAKLADVIRSFQ